MYNSANSPASRRAAGLVSGSRKNRESGVVRWLCAARAASREALHAAAATPRARLSLLRRSRCCTDTIMPNRKSPRVRAVPAVTRAIAILRLLSRSRTPQGLKAIAERLSIWCRARRCTLRARSLRKTLLQVDPLTKRYRLGVGMLPLARAVLENGDFPSLVRPKLDRPFEPLRRDGDRRRGAGPGQHDRRRAGPQPGAGAPPCRCREPVSRPDQRDGAMRRRVQRATAGRRSRSGFACCAGTTRRATTPGARRSIWCAGRASASIAATTIDGVTIVAVPVLGRAGYDLAHDRGRRPRQPARSCKRAGAGEAICAPLRKRSPRSSSPQLTLEVSAPAASVAQEGSERHRKR